jgi:hypothetical protein
VTTRPLADRLTGDTLEHFERMWRRIEHQIPTAMARYADGEQPLMEGRAISPTSQVGVEDGWWWEGGLTRLGHDLLATLNHREPEYFYAIPGHNDFAYMYAGTPYAAHVSRCEGRPDPPPPTPPAPIVMSTPGAAPPPAGSARLSTPRLQQRPPVDVTVVLNTYKRPHTLRQQYEAVIGQTRPPADVFVWQNFPDVGNGVHASPAEFDEEVLARCITARSVNTNFGVWGRFAFALNARTKYVCVLDDDTIPGARWIENCLETIRTHRGLLGTVGILHRNVEWFGQHDRVGWCAPNETVVQVDYVGHAWFFEREWLSSFWRELPSREWFAYEQEPYALCAGEDMHFSYTLQKYLGLHTYVPRTRDRTAPYGAAILIWR